MRRQLIALCIGAIATPTLMAQGFEDRVIRPGEAALDRAAETFDVPNRQAINNAQRNFTQAGENMVRGDLRDRTRMDLLNRNRFRATNRATAYRNVPMTQQSYGYQNSRSSSQVYTLRYDQSGREFICVGGQRVYFDSQRSSTNAISQSSDQDQRYRAGYGSYDNDGDQMQSDRANTDRSFRSDAQDDGDINAPALNDRDLDTRANADLDADARLNGQRDGQQDGQTRLRGDANIDADANVDPQSGVDADVDLNTDAQLRGTNNRANLRSGADVDANIDRNRQNADINAGANAAGNLNTSGETRANAAGSLNTSGETRSNASGNLNTSSETGANAADSLNTSGETRANASGNLNTSGDTGANAAGNLNAGGDANLSNGGSADIEAGASGGASIDGSL